MYLWGKNHGVHLHTSIELTSTNSHGASGYAPIILLCAIHFREPAQKEKKENARKQILIQSNNYTKHSDSPVRTQMKYRHSTLQVTVLQPQSSCANMDRSQTSVHKMGRTEAVWTAGRPV